MSHKPYLVILFTLLALLLSVGGVTAQGGGPTSQSVGAQTALGTGITYQGQLKNASGPVTNSCSMAFSLFDAAGSGSPPSGGAQIGNPITATVGVANGLFTVALNSGGEFGPSAFTGSARWLQIAVQCPGDSGFTTLAPRQALSPVPYALALPGLYTQQNAGSPNIIGGYSGNVISATVVGATIGGGGASFYTNTVTANYGMVGGGASNTASGGAATVGGGWANTASNGYATVGGGWNNTAGGPGPNGGATVGGGVGNTAGNDYATVGGGQSNTAYGSLATVGGGYSNTASYAATVGGGQSNTASYAATVGGGSGNNAGGQYATVSGGLNNTANDYATVSGGQSNTAYGSLATVGGGSHNAASYSYATVGGGVGNHASGGNATVAGGLNNTANDYATVSGGQSNTASGAWSTVGGGEGNTTSLYATVGGGLNNTANVYATVGGGQNNTSGSYATVGGGYQNTASNYYATVGGGYYNTANGITATVSGGQQNTASGNYATVGGGYHNTANGPGAFVGGGGYDGTSFLANYATGGAATIGGGVGNTAIGNYATVPGGQSNTAQGKWSFAAGDQASALHDGAFVWADAAGTPISSTAPNQFIIRAAGGVGINTASPVSHTLTVSGTIIAGGTTLPPSYEPLITEGSGSGLRLLDRDGVDPDWVIYPKGGTLRVYNDTAGDRLTIDHTGNVTTTGKLTASGGFNGQCLNGAIFSQSVGSACNMDVAEGFASTQLTQPGDLVVLLPQPTSTPTVRKSAQPYEGLLVGVVSANPGLVFDNGQTHLAGDNSQLITADNTIVALVGRVVVKVSRENGPIAIGDPLTSSSTPGVAMKATRAGKIIGYALEAANRAGQVLALVQPGYYLPPDGSQQGAANAELQTRVTQLQQQTADLQAQVSKLEQSSRPPLSGLPLAWLLFGGLLLVNLGFLLGRRWNAKKGVQP